MNRQWKTDFRCENYASPSHLAHIMQELHAEGWRTDTVKISGGAGDANGNAGWAIFSKTYELSPSLLEIDFPANVIWKVLNDTEIFGTNYEDARYKISRQISAKLKDWYEKNIPQKPERLDSVTS